LACLSVLLGHDLARSGYHVCAANETWPVSCLVLRAAPYVVRRPCTAGGWLPPWRMCNVTLYRMIYSTAYKEVTREVAQCCPGFVPVGRYCALRE